MTSTVHALHDLVDQVSDVPLWSMTGPGAGQTVVALEQLTSKVAALQARLLGQAANGADGWDREADLTRWLAAESVIARGEAGRRVVLARDLDGDHAIVAAAMANGHCSAAQARVIVEAVDRLGQVGDDVRDGAREHLVEAARTWSVPELRKLGQRVLEVLDPEHADELERRRVAAEEERALEHCALSMAQDGRGSWVGRFALPDLAGTMLHKALLAIANPARHRDPGAPSPRRLRLGEAFCEYVERFPADALPAAGGTSATVVVTLDHDQLIGDLTTAGVARLDTGHRLSAAEARRLACTSGLVPLVLGGASQPLDLGRERRLHTKAQRLAMGVRDGGCRADGCDWPPGMCHAHHLVPWSHGGRTTIDDGVLLCPRHHRLAHHPGRQLRLGPGRVVTFHRRT